MDNNTQVQVDSASIAVIKTQIGYIKDSQDDMKRLLASGYATTERVNSIDRRLIILESALRWFIGMLIIGLLGAIAKVIFIK